MRLTIPMRWGCWMALAAIPWAAFAADERACNMRDAALPGNSLTYVLCEQALLLVTSDDGATWAQRKISTPGSLRAVAFLDAKRGLAVGDGGAIMATEDAGRTWTARQSGTTENLTDIQMVGEQGWITGYDGVILHTADGGKTWTRQKAGVALSLEAMFFLDAQNGWVAGFSGTVLHTLDGGKTWRQVKIPGATWSLSSIAFLDANNGWVAGFAGQLFHTKDGGATWETRKTPVSGWLASVGFDSARRGWIATDEGFLVSEDGGETWKLQPTESQLFLNKILTGGGTTWALGPFGLLKQTGPKQWKKIVNPLSSNAVAEGK